MKLYTQGIKDYNIQFIIGEGQMATEDDFKTMDQIIYRVAAKQVYDQLKTNKAVAESFIFALGMIVAFIPEELLPTVTLALARGVQRMVKKNALVKNLSSVETLGCTTVID